MLCKAGLYKSGPSLATTIKKHFLIREHSDQYKGRHHLSTRQQPQEERQGEGLDRLEGRLWRRWSRRQQGWSRSPSQSHLLGAFCSWFFLSSPPWSPSQVPRSPGGSGCTWGPRWENRKRREELMLTNEGFFPHPSIELKLRPMCGQTHLTRVSLSRSPRSLIGACRTFNNQQLKLITFNNQQFKLITL